MNRRKLKKRIKYLLKKHIPFAINNHVNPDEVWFNKYGIEFFYYCTEPEDAGFIDNGGFYPYETIKLNIYGSNTQIC